jgi:hypothetical protein
MKHWFKQLAGVSVLAMSLVVFAPRAHAVEVGIGVRLGADFNASSYWPGNDIAGLYAAQANLTGDSTLRAERVYGLGVSFNAGLYADFRFVKWFSLTTALQLSLPRGGKDSLNITMGSDATKTGYVLDFNMKHTSIDFDLLAKFHVGWWYIGLGPGVTYNTAPKVSLTHTTYLLGQQVSSETFAPSSEGSRGSIGFNVVLDTGLNIPLGDGNHNITIGIRAALDLIGGFNAGYSLIETNYPDIIYEAPDVDTKFFGHTQVSIGLTVGYLYRFK